MAIAISTVLSRVAIDLHEEDNTFGTGLWTQNEMLRYVEYAEIDFLRRTGILKYDTTVAVVAGTTRLFTKPTRTMQIERMSFNGVRLRRQTSWDLEREDANWRATPNGRARYWHEDHLPVNQFELDRRPAAGGNLRIFYDTVPVEHADAPAGIAENIAVPDVWEPYIRWEVLSLALGKDGDNQDMERSDYAHRRYLLGVFLAKRMVIGSMELPQMGGQKQ
jgi:hypothetical protein